MRSKCDNGFSPYTKKHIYTKTKEIEIPYDVNFDLYAIKSEYFIIQNQDDSDYSRTSTGNLILNQKENHDKIWVGEENTSEENIWSANEPLITNLRYRVNVENYLEANMLIKFRQYHGYNSSSHHSWFRVLINGIQVGNSYNPKNRTNNPINYLNIDLSPYRDQTIDVELQQLGDDKDDKTELFLLDITGSTLSSVDNIVNISNVLLSPNPVINTLSISSDIPFQLISIYDINGRLTKLIKFDEQKNYELEMEEFSKGIYCIEVRLGTVQVVKKIIKL